MLIRLHLIAHRLNQDQDPQSSIATLLLNTVMNQIVAHQLHVTVKNVVDHPKYAETLQQLQTTLIQKSISPEASDNSTRRQSMKTQLLTFIDHIHTKGQDLVALGDDLNITRGYELISLADTLRKTVENFFGPRAEKTHTAQEYKNFGTDLQTIIDQQLMNPNSKLSQDRDWAGTMGRGLKHAILAIITLFIGYAAYGVSRLLRGRNFIPEPDAKEKVHDLKEHVTEVLDPLTRPHSEIEDKNDSKTESTQSESGTLPYQLKF